MSKKSSATSSFNLTYQLKKYPYLTAGTGSKHLVYLPSTADLLRSFVQDPDYHAKMLGRLVPINYTIHIIGYPLNYPAELSFDQLIADVAQIIREKIGSCSVLAWSFGGFIGTPLALMHPDLVNQLILFSSVPPQKNLPFEQNSIFRKWFRTAEKGDMRRLMWVFTSLYTHFKPKWGLRYLLLRKWNRMEKKYNSIATFRNAYAQLILYIHNSKLDFSKIACPILIIGGDKDPVFTKLQYQTIGSAIPSAKLILYPGEGHMLFAENPEEYRKAVQDFLK